MDISGTGDDDLLNGSESADYLRGLGGDDVLDGGLGNDTLDGGEGSDYASYASIQRKVTVRLTTSAPQAIGPGLGYDQLIRIENLVGSDFVDHLKGNSRDNVLIGGNSGDYLTGLGGNDYLIGDAGNDVLNGGGGDDYMEGGSGLNTATYVDATSGVTVDLRITGPQDTGGAGRDTLVQVTRLIGSEHGDLLIGNAERNRIDGGAGNDTIDAALQTSERYGDVLDGGDGYDVLSFERSAQVVRLGNGSIEGGSRFVHNFESFVGSKFNDRIDLYDGIEGHGGAGNDTINSSQRDGGDVYGDEGDDSLASVGTVYGGDGNDSLFGMSLDNNHILGGAGNDTLFSIGSGLLEGGEGVDFFQHYADEAATLDLNLSVFVFDYGEVTISGIEGLIGGRYGDRLIGNALANHLGGLEGSDTLDGGEGNDTLIGGGGLDTVTYATANGAVSVDLTNTSNYYGNVGATGAAGTDVMIYVERVIGSAFSDTIVGSREGNILNGGLGADTLRGNGHNDIFAFTVTGDSAPDARDLIMDFNKGDRIDLSAIDANTKIPSNQAFHMVAAFSNTAGELVLGYEAASGRSHLQADVNGDGSADMTIDFIGDISAFTANWIL